MVGFEDLEKRVQEVHPRADLELLRRAYEFSAHAHQGQTRRSGKPFLSHPLEVANILAEMKVDVVCVCVGLLHDVVEDTLTTTDTLRESFGEEVAHLSRGSPRSVRSSFLRAMKCRRRTFASFCWPWWMTFG